ncbi:MAG: NAD(P)/FAD-dependent oxidoreductase [Lachnospira sp.]|nr:NAD(P)/FAD-dependent oxidoreductase [Lachnospira sp.]
MKEKDVIIIGAGASGMTLAIECARNGKNVLLLEHNDKVGKKILSTGNGKCNLTNMYIDDTCYRSNNTAFAYKIIEGFGANDTIAFFRSLGVLPKDKNGYIYPKSEQASAVLSALTIELERLKVELLTNTKIIDIKNNNGIMVVCDNGTYKAKNLVIATGSMAAPKTGSDGSGYELARKLSHKVIAPLPALVQLRINNKMFKSIAGVRCEANVTAYVNNKEIANDRGELQLTDYGISGIPVFQISRYIVNALYNKKNAHVIIDFMPSMTKDDIVEYIKSLRKHNKNMTFSQLFLGILNKKLIEGIMKSNGFNENAYEKLETFVDLIKAYKMNIDGYNSYDNAQVCQGGVDVNELKETMESKLADNVYFIGEIVDVEGKCGGYNLQWAFASAMTAAKDICKKGN